MPTSYPESAARHLDDAELLWSSNDPKRLPNASQLFGFTAECALKGVLIGLGVPNDNQGGVANYHHFGHLPNLWQQFMVYAAGQLGGKYTAALNPLGAILNPFANWNVNDRYAPDVHRTGQIGIVAGHRDGARDCFALMQLAQEDGIL